MIFWKNNPFIRLIFFLLTGILLGNYLPQSELVLLFLLPGLIMGLAWFYYRHKYLIDLLSSLVLSVLILISGMELARLNHIPANKPLPHPVTFTAILLEAPVEKSNSHQATFQINIADSMWLCNQKVLGYFEKNDEINKLNIGDLITGKSNFRQVKNKGNPFEFDYERYMKRQKIIYSTFLKTDHYQIEKSNQQNSRIIAEKIRARLITLLKTNLKDHESYEVVSALTLGYRKELTQEVRSYFAKTGAMHVLAVSGLHVGMIFMFLARILAFLKRSKAGRILNFILILFGLWAYALLAGFSPSVQRATVMFTFILIGNSLNRPVPIYNSIAASAFLLLLINPNLIFEVGFQLSYMAVISIVFFYPRLEKIIQPRNRAIKWTWQLFCVSLAAQIGTFPLSIFYFHQFPLLFWLSNFIVIPAAYLILGLTFAFFIFYKIAALSKIFAIALNSVTLGTIESLKFVGTIPHTVIQGVSVSSFQLATLLLAIGTIMFFIKSRQKRYLFAVLIFFLLFQIDGFTNRLFLFNQKKLVIYQAKENIFHFVDGRDNYLLIPNEQATNDFIYRNTITQLRLNQPQIITIGDTGRITSDRLILENPVVQFSGKTILLPINPFPKDHSRDDKLLAPVIYDLPQEDSPLINLMSTGKLCSK